jgi:outer membrane protein OmpA-like peptidoglycan-associated protein
VAAIGPLAVFYPSDVLGGAPDEALMDRDGMASSLPRLLVTRMTSFAFALIFLALGAWQATAQTVIGERSRPSVTVDTSVLDALGPPPTLPDRLRGKPTPRQTTMTTGRQRPAKTAAVPVRKKRVAESRHRKSKPDIAARRAAPVAPVAASGTAAAPREAVAAVPLSEPVPTTPAPTPPTTSEAPAKEPVSTPTAAVAAPKAPEVATAAPAEPTPAPVTKPAAATPPPAAMPTTMAPTPVPPATPPRQLPTATPSSDARVVMNTPPTVAPPASAPAPVPPQTQAAALTSVAVAAAGSTRVLFSAGAAELPDAARGELDAVVRQLSSNDRRLQLVGYAGSTTDEANQARRVSLQRALAVRTYLMEHGVPNTRMDVRALGNRADGKDPPDRVDIVMLDR